MLQSNLQDVPDHRSHFPRHVTASASGERVHLYRSIKGKIFLLSGLTGLFSASRLPLGTGVGYRSSRSMLNGLEIS